jgi:hypothetical protein
MGGDGERAGAELGLPHRAKAARRMLLAMHALACDRCREGTCRSAEGDAVPLAMSMMVDDPDSQVRAQAITVVGESVHRHSDAVAALRQALAAEPDPTNRKIIRWWLPGGPRFERTRPRRP